MAKKIVAKKTNDVEVVEVKKPQPEAQVTIRCISAFVDAKEGVVRSSGDEWQVTSGRLAQIQAVEEAQGIKLVEVL